jgi:ABC-type multidrug transport system fused ATPase/permease subunit
MRFFRIYGRVLGLLGRDIRVAGFLAFANLIVAGLQFLDPVLFGRVVNLLSHSDSMAPATMWHEAAVLLGVWVIVGIGGILSNIFVSVRTERLAHKHRINSMGKYFQHVLALPLSFHGDTHSGRLIKSMLAGTEGLFATWLVFFRDQLSTIISAAVLLPLTLFLNWRLALVLIALVGIFLLMTALVVRKTETAQRKVEGLNSSLAGTAQDALANVMVVQSFTRLSAEGRLFSDIANQVIRHQFPVLNWHLAARAWHGQRGRDRQLHGHRDDADRAPGNRCVLRLVAVLQAAGAGGLLRHPGLPQQRAGEGECPYTVGATRRRPLRGCVLRLPERR